MVHLLKISLVCRGSRTQQQELWHKSHLICLRSTHFENSTGCQFSRGCGPKTGGVLGGVQYDCLQCKRQFARTGQISEFLIFAPQNDAPCTVPPAAHVPLRPLPAVTGSRSFRAAAPTVWNSPPDSIRSFNTLNSFRRHLKTHYFQAESPSASDSLVINGAL